jgi:hypothetical protein
MFFSGTHQAFRTIGLLFATSDYQAGRKQMKLEKVMNLKVYNKKEMSICSCHTEPVEV